VYLLDTCVISELVKAKPAARVVAWIEAQRETDLYLSVITVGEIEEGVAALPDGVKRARLLNWVRRTLPERFAKRLLAVDLPVAVAWGQRRGTSRQTLPAVDGLIAATAQFHGLTVATRNVADFRRFGVLLANPWE
jgi:predicted nucleic acid-binding protein